MSIPMKRNLVSLNVDGEMTKVGMIGGGLDDIDKFITVDDEASTSFTKMHINVKNGVKHKALEKTDIADNLETDDANKVLSAKQGKVLKDDLTQLQTGLIDHGSTTGYGNDANNCVATGCYRVSNPCANAPSNDGFLITFNPTGAKSITNAPIIQFFVESSGTPFMMRSAWYMGWRAWKTITTT